MKKCPSCGMANSDTIVCLYCNANLGKVEDDPELKPQLPEFSVYNMTGNAFGNKQLSAFKNVLDEQTKRKK